jgi:hypothetical protein
MSKLLFLCCIFMLVGCDTMTKINRVDSLPPIRDVLDASETCPHLCWLGINPSTTTTEQAKTLIGNSNSLDQQWTKISNTDIFAIWFVGGSKSSTCTVSIQLEKGFVQSISMGPMLYTVGDIVELLGQPDQIAMAQLVAPDQPFFTYALYYDKRRITVDVHTTSTKGPQPSDKGYNLWLNVEFYAVTHPEQWGKPQPWLGYGHLREYLPGVEIPPTNQP